MHINIVQDAFQGREVPAIKTKGIQPIEHGKANDRRAQFHPPPPNKGKTVCKARSFHQGRLITLFWKLGAFVSKLQ
jgi:hypothetical protein